MYIYLVIGFIVVRYWNIQQRKRHDFEKLRKMVHELQKDVSDLRLKILKVQHQEMDSVLVQRPSLPLK